jgi:DNA-binding response OmpR family regulator
MAPHILLIEDNQANADMIIHILQTAGFEVRHFVNGLEGARDARRERPGLILMDFNLPDIDGRTLSLLLKQQLGDRSAPPIVACTARTGDTEIKLAAKFGCTAMISKPFAPEELVSLVKKYLQSPASGTPSTISNNFIKEQ